MTEITSPHRRLPRTAPRWPLAAMGAAIIGALLVIGWLVEIDSRPALRWIASRLRWSGFGQELVHNVLLSPLFYLPLLGILALEWVIPVKKDQPLFSRGLCQDFIYFLADIFSQTVILFYWLALLKYVYDHTLSFLTIDSIANWPYWTRIVLAILVVDFLAWLHHVIRHRIVWLWHFHTVHHSQREMNAFTDFRYHVLEYLVANVITFIPMFALGVGPWTIWYITLIKAWHRRLYHANIRTNLGPLRYLLVTPQSHRIHHSIHPDHANKNFGVAFSLWDQLFGTQHRGWNEYPDTGLEDETFPLERTYADVLKAPVRQFMYPFKAISASMRESDERNEQSLLEPQQIPNFNSKKVEKDR